MGIKANAIREHNFIHSAKEERAIRITQYLNEAADLMELEEQGLLVRLPCKIGTVCYRREYDSIYPTVFNYGDIPHFGRTIFLTQEEAKMSYRG